MAAIWPWREGAFGSLWLAPVLALGYAAVGLVQYLGLKRHPDGMVGLQYFTMCADAAAFAVLLCDAPEVTAFASPYLIFLSMQTGMRYGVRSFWLAWGSAVLSVPPILWLGHPFWRSHPQLGLALAFGAVLLAACFGPVLRKLHARQQQVMEDSKLQALEAAMVAKSAFLARVSHQLRSPLQAIVSSLELMESPSQQAMQRQLVENISVSASKLSTELRDLLTIARAEAWQLQLEPSTFDAGMVLESVATEIAPEAAALEGRIFKVVPQAPLFVVADSDKIVQVLANIAKHLLVTTRTPSLLLAMKGYDAISRSVTFVVEGESGPAATAPAALPATAAAGDEKRRDELNDSLSLTLVKTLVDFLGGGMAPCSSSPSRQGFSVTIPCEVISEDEDALRDSETPRVLLVTVNPRARTDAQALAARMGYELEDVDSMPVAANRLAFRDYALVLVDLNLPKRSAKRLAQALKNSDCRNRETPVLAFNARPASDAAGPCWPFDTLIAGAPGDAHFSRAISALPPAKSPH